MKLNDNKFYKLWFRNPWTYITGAVLLSLAQIVTLAVSDNPIGISGTFANWGIWLYMTLGGNVDSWHFASSDAASALSTGFLNDPGSIRNIGIILGALLASLLASQFNFKKIKSRKQVLVAIIGGLLMGYGATIGFGCNIGALYGGIASLSLSGWVYAFFMLLGTIVGSKILVRYFM